VITVDPQVAALIATFVLGFLVGLPGLQRAARRRAEALRRCLSCGRTVVLGERTCDCGPDGR
jgi:hypothetical protein